MNLFYTLLIFILIIPPSLFAQSFTESFETDGEGTRYESNNFTNGCNADWFRRTFDGECSTSSHNFRDVASNNTTNEDGTFYFGGSDVDEGNTNENPLGDDESAYMVFPTQAIVGSNNSFTVTAKFVAEFDGSGTFEGEEELYVEYAFDTDIAMGANCPGCLPMESNVNSGNYTVIGAFLANTSTNLYQEDTDLDGIPDGATLSDFFTDYAFNVTTATNPSNISIRIRFFHDNSSEDVAFDHIRLTSSVALPVELSSFVAETNDQATILTWTTESESNNAGFEVQESLNGADWRNIGFVEGHGTTLEHHQYRYTANHNAPFSTKYFRLKQIDFDGRYDFSNVVSSTLEGKPTSLFLAPNPVRDILRINGLGQGEYSFTLYDFLGRSIAKQTITDNTLDVSTLLPGRYVLQLDQDGKLETLVFVKQ